MGREAEELAAQLRAFKEGSGRSYGWLAARLHLSTSTLHRYCHGTAVPVDFTPLERFAKLCGADRGRVLELRQCWVLADAARNRDPRGDAVPAPTVPAPPDPPAAVAAGEPGTASRDALRRRRPGWVGTPGRRRLAWAAGALVAVAAVGVAVVLEAGTPGTSSRTAQPHPSASPATPAPASGTARSSADGASASPSAEPPVQVDVLDNNWDDPCDRWYLSSRPPADVAAPPAEGPFQQWARSQSATPAGDQRLEITVQGSGRQPVVLHALYVHVFSSAPAPRGNAYNTAVGCGGGLTPASFGIDLDTIAPTAEPTSGTRGDATLAAPRFPLPVSATEPEVLDVDATTAGHDVHWDLELLWSSGTRQGTTVIDDHGQPFHTVARTGDPAYIHVLGTPTTWTPDPSTP